jgi:ABC-type bacteriocin/lantibiotic exporter with double-glycine peptidase domain
MKDKMKFYVRRIKEGRLKELIIQTVWIYSYVRKYWKSITLYTLIGLMGTALSLISSLISKDMVDIITGHQTGVVLKTFVMFISIAIGTIIANQISNYVSSMISIKVDNDIKADIFNKMLITDLESLMSYHTGDLLMRWSSDASTISNGVLNWIPNLIIYIVKFISALAIVVYYDPTFALLAMMGIPVSIIMSRTILSRMQSNNKRSAAMSAKMNGFNQETFSNIQTIKAFDLIPQYVKYLKHLQTEYLSMKKDFQKMTMITSMIMAFVGIGVSYSCYGLGIYRVWSGAISYGTMTLFLSLAGTLTGTLNSLISMVPTAINITTSAGRLMDILNMPRENYDAREEVRHYYEEHKEEGLSIRLSNISYTYHNGTEVFKNASFEAHPHEIVAVVGMSGEGKTTLNRILLSLITPYEGELKLYAGNDDHNVSQGMDFSPAIRQLYSYVPQGNTMFSGTIEENMRNIKPDATDEEIKECLEMACAWKFVDALPEGIYSKIGERGNGFSEGQAQRLSIARALLRHSPILLLDEATSALDVATEREILRNIMKDTYPRTCIVATHRPTVLTLCSKVYEIHDKRCELLSKEEIDKKIKDF